MGQNASRNSTNPKPSNPFMSFGDIYMKYLYIYIKQQENNSTAKNCLMASGAGKAQTIKKPQHEKVWLWKAHPYETASLISLTIMGELSVPIHTFIIIGKRRRKQKGKK